MAKLSAERAIPIDALAEVIPIDAVHFLPTQRLDLSG